MLTEVFDGRSVVTHSLSDIIAGLTNVLYSTFGAFNEVHNIGGSTRGFLSYLKTFCSFFVLKCGGGLHMSAVLA